MQKQLVKRAELFQPFPGNFGSHERHAWDVIDGVANQSLKIDDLIGSNSPIGLECRRVVKLILAHVENLHARRDQLPAVFVGSDQKTFAPQLVGSMGDGGQNVVGFVRRQLERRDAHCREHPLDGGELRPEVERHLAPLPLILGEQHMPKCRLGPIEGHEQIVGLLLVEQEQQIARKAIHRRHRLAARAGHLRNGMKHLKDQRVGVDHPNRLTGQRGRLDRPCRRLWPSAAVCGTRRPRRAICGARVRRRLRRFRARQGFILHAGKHRLTSHERAIAKGPAGQTADKKDKRGKRGQS